MRDVPLKTLDDELQIFPRNHSAEDLFGLTSLPRENKWKRQRHRDNQAQ
jgi:hypothetical protein